MNPAKEIANVVVPKIRMTLWGIRVNQNVARNVRAEATRLGLTRRTFHTTSTLGLVDSLRVWFGIKPSTSALLCACHHVGTDLVQVWGKQPAVPQH